MFVSSVNKNLGEASCFPGLDPRPYRTAGVTVQLSLCRPCFPGVRLAAAVRFILLNVPPQQGLAPPLGAGASCSDSWLPVLAAPGRCCAVPYAAASAVGPVHAAAGRAAAATLPAHGPDYAAVPWAGPHKQSPIRQ